jgi:hypothetical protein
MNRSSSAFRRVPFTERYPHCRFLLPFKEVYTAPAAQHSFADLITGMTVTPIATCTADGTKVTMGQDLVISGAVSQPFYNVGNEDFIHIMLWRPTGAWPFSGAGFGQLSDGMFMNSDHCSAYSTEIVGDTANRVSPQTRYVDVIRLHTTTGDRDGVMRAFEDSDQVGGNTIMLPGSIDNAAEANYFLSQCDMYMHALFTYSPGGLPEITAADLTEIKAQWLNKEIYFPPAWK